MNSIRTPSRDARRRPRPPGRWRGRLGLALLLAALPAAAGPQQQPAEEPADSFVDRIDVTATELMIDVRDRRGNLVLGLGPEDFEVVEDGRPMPVIGVDYPPADPVLAGALAQAAGGEPPGWRFMVYFDLVLTQNRAVRRAAELLSQRADELVALGAVELVVANPRPVVVEPFTRDAERLRQELGAIARLPASHQLASIRRDFLHALDMRLHLASPGASEAASVRNQIRSAADREFQLLNRRLIILGQWIGAYGHVPGSAAILVSDGFDMNPGEFYLSASSLPGLEAELSLDLDRYRVDPLTDALAQEMSALGWTSVAIALGGVSELATTDASMSYRDRFRSIGEPGEISAGPESGSPVSLLRNPHEPLLLVSDKTGGELMTTRKTAGRAIDRVGERIRLTYLAPRPSDGIAHRVVVRAKAPGLTVRAPRWVRSPTREQTAAARARRLLVLSSDGGEMPVRLTVGELAAAGPETRRASVEIFFDLDLVRAVLPRPSVPMAFTFGIDVPEAPPLVYEVTQTVTLPADEALEDWPEFLYRVVLDLPVKARRLSLVVEEPQSGIWGGATHGL